MTARATRQEVHRDGRRSGDDQDSIGRPEVALKVKAEGEVAAVTSHRLNVESR